MKRRQCLSALFLIPLCAAVISLADRADRAAAATDIDAIVLPNTIPASDKRIHYIGRFDTTSPEGPRCEWPMSAVEIRFHGDGLNVVINEEGEDRYEVILDGSPQSVLPVRNGRHVYDVVNNLPDADHTVAI